MAFQIKYVSNFFKKQYWELPLKTLGLQMFFFTVLIDLRSIEMLLKCPEVQSNDDTWIRLKFFFMQKKNNNKKMAYSSLFK